MADAKLTDLTAMGAMSLDDLLYLVDVSDTTDNAAGSSRKAALSFLISMSGYPFQARLSLSSNNAIPTSDLTASGSLFLVAYQGGQIALYDTTATAWKLYQVNTYVEKVLTGLTSGKNYDVFIYDSSGTLTLDLIAWTNDTTRATALTTQNNIYVLTGSLNKRYVGTIRTTSTTTTEDSKAKRFVWNYYNRLIYEDFTDDTTNSFTSSGNGTWAAINSGNAAWKFEFVIGVVEDPIVAEAHLTISTGFVFSIAINSTTSPDRAKTTFCTGTSTVPAISKFTAYPAIGYSYLQVLSSTSGAGTFTASGDNGGIFGGGTIATNSGLFRRGYK